MYCIIHFILYYTTRTQIQQQNLYIKKDYLSLGGVYIKVIKSEEIAYQQYLLTNYNKEEITHVVRPGDHPDFVTADGRQWEVNKLYGETIVIRHKQAKFMFNNQTKTKIIAVDLKNEVVARIIPASELTTTTQDYNGVKITWSLSDDIGTESSKKRTPLTFAIKTIKRGLHSRYNALYRFYRGYGIDAGILEELKRYNIINNRNQVTALFHYEIKNGLLTLYVMHKPLYCRENCNFRRLKGCKNFHEAETEEDWFGNYYKFDMTDFVNKTIDELVEGCTCD